MVQTADDDVITSHAYRISPPKGPARGLSEEGPRRNKQRRGSMDSPPDPMGRLTRKGKGHFFDLNHPKLGANLKNEKSETTVKDFTL